MVLMGLGSGVSKSSQTVPSEVQIDLAQDFLNAIHFVSHPAEYVCRMGGMDNHFKSNRDMVNDICTKENQNMSLSRLKQYLQFKGAKSILEKQHIPFDTFVENLHFFLSQNDKMSELVTSLKSSPNWKFDKPSRCESELWEERLASNENTFMKRVDIETSKGQVSFIASNHFYNLRAKEDVSQAKKELKHHFDQIKPKAIVIEGFEVGKKLPCKYVLSKVFEDDEMIKSETDLSVKIAFNNRIAIIPGDSQQIDNVDIEINSDFSSERLASLGKELQIVHFLYFYYSHLQNNNSRAEENAIEELKRRGIHLDLNEVKAMYRKLNDRELPKDADAIYEDFNPSKNLKSPKGTNLLVDVLDKIRNQGLVTAIQFGLINYEGAIMPVYGPGHLPEVAPSLELKQPDQQTNKRCKT